MGFFCCGQRVAVRSDVKGWDFYNRNVHHFCRRRGAKKPSKDFIVCVKKGEKTWELYPIHGACPTHKCDDIFLALIFLLLLLCNLKLLCSCESDDAKQQFMSLEMLFLPHFLPCFFRGSWITKLKNDAPSSIFRVLLFLRKMFRHLQAISNAWLENMSAF